VRIHRSDRVGSRADLAHVCNDLHLIRTAVEVGTDRGLYAREFMSRWCGETLYCVDNWQPYPGMNYGRDGDFDFAVHTLAPFAHRCKIVRADSHDAARTLNAPGPFEFIYIDGDHRYEAVLADLQAWFPRLAGKGVIAGHDIDQPDVARAVVEFFAPMDMRVERTSDYWAPSWFVVRNPA
jgi:hypothetical protein